MPIVTIHRSGAPPLTTEISVGMSVFDAGAKVAAGIETACVGKGTCGLCRVRIVAGASNLNPYTDDEAKHLGNVYHLTKIRLACRCKPVGDVTIEVVAKRTRK